MPAEGAPSGQWSNPAELLKGATPPNATETTWHKVMGWAPKANCVTAASIGGADFQQPLPNQRYGLRNREEKLVRPERCGPPRNAAEAFCNWKARPFPLAEDC